MAEGENMTMRRPTIAESVIAGMLVALAACGGQAKTGTLTISATGCWQMGLGSDAALNDQGGFAIRDSGCGYKQYTYDMVANHAKDLHAIVIGQGLSKPSFQVNCGNGHIGKSSLVTASDTGDITFSEARCTR